METTRKKHENCRISNDLIRTVRGESTSSHGSSDAGGSGEDLGGLDRQNNFDSESESLLGELDGHSLESIVELKISRFLDQLGTYYPENIYEMIMKKVEKPLVKQILLRTGGNQVHASRILGINRNTLRKKIKTFGL